VHDTWLQKKSNFDHYRNSPHTDMLYRLVFVEQKYSHKNNDLLLTYKILQPISALEAKVGN